MKSIATLALFVFASTFTFAQEKSEVKKPQTVTKQQTVSKNDPYLGREEKIKSITKDGKIPASYPKFETGMSVEDYKQIVAQWLRDNKDLIKEEAYAKLEPKLNK